VDVIREEGPHVRPDALLMDVTSLKSVPLQAMLESTRASVAGTHPMFGPGVHSLQGQRVVLCSGRGADWEEWLRQQLAARGLVVTDASPDKHDHAMAVVQVLTHYHTQVVGLALARMGMPVQESLEFTSPVYRMELLITGRHFAQSPDLYGPIEMMNPRCAEVTRVFQEAAQEVASALLARDQTRFAAVFAEVREYFQGFTQVALEQSSFLIDRLVERS
jgi:chorismate mutase / prephenate dehydrogenase